MSHLRQSSAVPPRLYAVHPSNPEEERFRLFDSVARLLKRSAGTEPLIIVLDDLQEADQSSLLMLRFVATQLKEARVLLIGSYREAEVRSSPALSRLIGEIAREGEQVLLSGLRDSEIASWLQMRGGGNVSPALLSALIRATAGNPLFIDGMLRMLAVDGRGLDAERRSFRDFRLPDGVRETIRHRLSFLSKASNKILSIAAVIGQEFEFECLRRIAGGSADLIIEALSEGHRDGLIDPILAGGVSYRFGHDLIRETIYDDLPAVRRVSLHLRIAETLETIHHADPTAHLAELAHHYRESVAIGDAAKAIDYSIRAGEAALAVSAYEETRNHWQAAIALMARFESGTARHADLVHKLAVLTCDAIDLGEGILQLEAALKLIRETHDERRTAAIHLKLGFAKTWLGPHLNISDALAHYRAAETRIEANDLSSLASLSVGQMLANRECFFIDDALEASDRATKLYKEIGDDSLLTVTAAHRARCLLVRGRLTEAVSLLSRVITAAPNIPDPEATREAFWSAAWYYLVLRAPLEAKRLFNLGVERTGLLRLRLQRNFDFVALADCLSGDLASARKWRSTIPSFRARIALREGDWDSARALLQEQLEVNQADKWLVFDTLSHIVDLLYLTGDYDRARAVLPGLLHADGSDEPFCQLRSRPSATLLSLDSDNVEEALNHLECCRHIMRRGEDWLGLAGPVARAEAAFAAADNRLVDAGSWFEQSLSIFRKFVLPFDAADTWHFWGRALLNAGQPASAREKFDAAIHLYRQHGAGQRWIDSVADDQRRALETVTQRNGAEPKTAEALQGCWSFSHEGNFWVIGFGDRIHRFKDAKGFHYLSYLLSHPGTEVPATDLAASTSGPLPAVEYIANGADFSAIHPDLGDAGPQIDARAKSDYARRISELRGELAQAQRFNDLGKAERCRSEIEALAAQLRGATGFRGMDRSVASHAERARWAVSKRIRFAIRQIQKSSPALGDHLSKAIRTGLVCVYQPIERIDWRF
jgi:tetratricopeptide (TPR) repeat protein